MEVRERERERERERKREREREREKETSGGTWKQIYRIKRKTGMVETMECNGIR